MRTHHRLFLVAACLSASVLAGGQSASAGLFSRGGSHGSSGGSGGGSWGSGGGSSGGSWGSGGGSRGGLRGLRGGSWGSRGGSHGSSGGSSGGSGGSSWGSGGGSAGAYGSGGGSWGSAGGYPVAQHAAPAAPYYAQADGDGTGARVAYVSVKVPADSTVYLQNQRMTLGGSDRRFATPPLEDGTRHRYTVRVEVVRAGRTLSKTAQVMVEPGLESQVVVSFDEPGPSRVQVATASR